MNADRNDPGYEVLKRFHVEHPYDAGNHAERLQLALDDIDTEASDLPQLTQIIIASDRLAARNATEMVEYGVPWRIALAFTGSYSRIGWLLDIADRGWAPRRDVLAMLPGQWPHADPDDTDPRFLSAWSEAWNVNHRRTLLDDASKPLPPGRMLRIYRGQGTSDKPGIAWSLDENVAGRFANGAALRVPGGVKDPVVYVARVHRRMVIAYLTGRKEAEVIVNPFTLSPA